MQIYSQFFANIYLNSFDHFVKEQIKASQYIRYVDDFALFSDDKMFLENARVRIEEYLAGLRIKIHPIKSQLFETKHGANFVGFRILPDRIRVRSDNLRLARKRLRKMLWEYEEKDYGKCFGNTIKEKLNMKKYPNQCRVGLPT